MNSFNNTHGVNKGSKTNNQLIKNEIKIEDSMPTTSKSIQYLKKLEFVRIGSDAFNLAEPTPLCITDPYNMPMNWNSSNNQNDLFSNRILLNKLIFI